METEGGPILEVMEVVQEPVSAATPGTLRRSAEEGRGRPRVRFTAASEAAANAAATDEAAEGVRKVSGRQSKFEMSERGSIRSRVPLGSAG